VWNQDVLTEYDNAINYAFSKGLKIYLVTNTPSFAQNFASDVYQNITFQYHQFLASRYQGKIAVWQVFNEADIHNFKNYSTITGFDAAYLASLSSAVQAAASAIKQVNPGIRIAANVCGSCPQDSWQQYFSALINNIDVIGIDLYPANNNDIQGYPALIQSVKSQFGKEIIVSETGMCTRTFPDQVQAAIISNTIATLKLAPVDAILVYMIRDGNTTASDCESTFGIKRNDGTQKPAYGEVMRALSGVPLSHSSAVVSWGPNRIDAFMRGEDAALWHIACSGFCNGPTWSGWQSLGGALTSLPVAVSWGPNRIDAFAIGTDNGLRHIAWNGSTWSGWESLGGDPTSPPAVVSWGPNRLDIFIRGSDYGLWHKAWNGNAWSSWESLGGFLTSAPAAVSWGPNRIDIFVRGGDYSLYHKEWNGNAWSPWHWAGGILASAPVAVSSGSRPGGCLCCRAG
jgi:hypothetical protein